MDATGVLDEAWERLHGAGPERMGRLTNHAPMAVEALVARGRGAGVHRWVGRYARKLEEFPAGVERVTGANWASALGDARRVADWVGYFQGEVGERGWSEVLAEWWPRLLPGMYGGSTHPVIRVGHAVRTLLAGETGPRLNELAHGLGYWAARHRPVTGLTPLPGASSAAAALEAVRPIAVRDGGFPARLDRVTGLPVWAADVTDPAEAHRRLTELVRAATHRYATHALRTLPALPRDLWVGDEGALAAALRAIELSEPLA
ncbi:questin oxidase family protein [Streptomyces bauhiniae]